MKPKTLCLLQIQVSVDVVDGNAAEVCIWRKSVIDSDNLSV